MTTKTTIRAIKPLHRTLANIKTSISIEKQSIETAMTLESYNYDHKAVGELNDIMDHLKAISASTQDLMDHLQDKHLPT